MKELDGLKLHSIDLAGQFDARTEGIENFFAKRAVNQGTNLYTLKAKGTLAENTKHVAGEEISDSSVSYEKVSLGEIEFHATKLKADYQQIQNYGEEYAIDQKDKELLSMIEGHIENSLITNMVSKAGDKNLTAPEFKRALARGKGRLKTKQGFKNARAIAFVNTEDYFEYLEDAPLTTQTLFGMDYVEKFLGFQTIFYTDKLERGQIVITADGNLELAHVPASGAAFGAIGLTATSNGLVAFKHYVNDDTGDIYSKVHFAIESYAKRSDAVIVVTLEEGPESGE